MKTPLALALLMPVAAFAGLPRLAPLFDLADTPFRPSLAWLEAMDDYLDRWDGGEPPSLRVGRDSLAEPFVFWSDDGLLCAPTAEDADQVDCHDPVRAVPVVRRKRPLKVTLPEPTLQLGQARFSKDGSITGGDFTTVARLRCARSPWLDRGEYRYLPGPQRLAVLVLEEDDVRATCARLDAQCAAGFGPRYWRVLVSLSACPTP